MELRKKVKKELERTEFAIAELEVKDSEEAEDLERLIRSYYKDARYFYEKGEFLKAFELFSYVWGLLDAGARLGVFEPGEAREHYKINQEQGLMG